MQENFTNYERDKEIVQNAYLCLWSLPPIQEIPLLDSKEAQGYQVNDGENTVRNDSQSVNNENHQEWVFDIADISHVVKQLV